MTEHATRAAPGAQTLARGLVALRAVAAAESGLAVQEVAERLEVHRTIAYRLLTTLADAQLIARGPDGRYRGAVGLLQLRAAGYETIKRIAQPELAALAEQLDVTTSLLVAEQDTATALLVVEPRSLRYRITFQAGSSHPIDRGAAGHALRSVLPEWQDDAGLAPVRELGYAISHGEVEPGAWGLAAPLRVERAGIVACVNLISHREELIRQAGAPVVATARRLEALLAAQS